MKYKTAGKQSVQQKLVSQDNSVILDQSKVERVQL